MSHVNELRALLPEVVTDPDVLASFRRDEAVLFDGGEGTPLALLRPTSTAEVACAVRWAAKHRVPVVPQGARTGLTGGANATDGALIVNLERMDAILNIDRANRLAVAQPGVVNATLRRAVAEQGLFYPPDPGSFEISTIGGNVATNAGGMCCVRYGVTTDHVLALEVVLASGEVLRCGRGTVKGVAGYDLTSLFVGSEGTLGVITEITVALRPAPPPSLTVVALFAELRDAGATTAAITEAGIVPGMLELLDGVHLRAVEAWRPMGLDPAAQAMLLISAEGDDVARVEALCRANRATEVYAATTVAEAEALLEARRVSHWALESLAERTHGATGAFLIEDVAVPRSCLVDLIDAVNAIAEEHRVLVAVLGHAGDGNLHPKILLDRADPKSVAAARAAFDDIMKATLAMGGTCTGEHGVGLLKRDWLTRELSPIALQTHRAIKRALDPDAIMNPGKVFTAH